MKDVLRPYVPEYKGQVTSDDGERKFFQKREIDSIFTMNLFFLHP